MTIQMRSLEKAAVQPIEKVLPVQSELKEVKLRKNGTEGRRYKRGYNTNHLSEEIRAELKAKEQSHPLASITEAVLTVLTIPATGSLALWAIWEVHSRLVSQSAQIAVSVLIYLVASVIIARQQRGLELMVHDASHLTWWRSRPEWNNRLSNLLVAYPVMSSIKNYWKSHRIHHGAYGGHDDPCRQRFADMGLAHLDLSTKAKIAKAVLRWLPSYNVAYYREIGSVSSSIWAAWAVWHVSVLILPAALLSHLLLGTGFGESIMMGFGAWIAFWAVPSLVVLPVLRSIAESEEHDYSAGDTEFETTYTNDGFMHHLLFHPKNDAYHLIHHLFPNIPERQHKRVHKLLMKHDPIYREGLLRKTLLDS